MSTLTKITREAKRIRKAHPRKYDKLSNPWGGGYIVEAARNVKRGKVAKPAKKKVAKPVKRKKVKRKPAKKKVVSRSVTRSVTRSVGSTAPRRVGKKRPGKKRAAKRKVSGVVRRRSVGKKSNTGLILGIGALALGAVYLMTRGNNSGYQYQGQQLPAVQQTGNPTRDQKTNNVLQWAMAGGVAISAITALIDRLNSSSDQEVDSIYNNVATGGSDYLFT